MSGKLRELEGQLLKLEGELLLLRGKVGRATGEAGAKASALLAQVEGEVESLRQAGQTALKGLGRAVETGQAAGHKVEGLLREVESLVPTAGVAARKVLRRASIEAKAVRHGVRVGLRVARRAARRARAGRAEA
jgi:hypothetical protein